jgi:hypothetical protein
MTAADLVYPVLGSVAGFVCALSIPLLGLSLLHMIGKGNV